MLQSMGLQRVGHNLEIEQQQQNNYLLGWGGGSTCGPVIIFLMVSAFNDYTILDLKVSTTSFR